MHNKRTKWFEELRFGMFIHWGLFSIPGRDAWFYSTAEYPKDEYESLFHRFNPVGYDAKEWASICKAAGMKYAVLTAKHHEGFCLWDTNQTDYNIMNTSFKRDIVREWVDAFRAEGIRVGLYFSLIDWHHPHFIIDKYHPQRAKKDELNKGRDFGIYVDFMEKQIEELLTQYGKIDIFWPDFPLPEAYRADGIIAKIRSWQPGIIINNRFGRHGEFESDFATPEQYIPEPGGLPAEAVNSNDSENGEGANGDSASKNVGCWETCMTIGATWGYYRGETLYKTPRMVISQLVKCVSKNGNLLLNVGPNPRGYIPREFEEVLREVGVWMKYNGESIYGCGASKYKLDAELAAPIVQADITQRGNDVYLHFIDFCPPHPFYFDTGEDKIDYIELLSDKSEIKFKTSRINDQEMYCIEMPIFQPDLYDTVVYIVLAK